MAVPEAAVHEYHRPVFRKDDIRSTRQRPDLDAEPQPPGEKILPDYQLRFRILPLDRRHASVALLRCHRVRHTLTTIKIQ